MTTTTGLAELTGEYVLDAAHTRIGFSARHAMVTKVRGAFNEFEGTVHIDGADPSKSSARLVIKTDSIDTRNKQRDDHLRSNDFLDIPTFPEITFVSTEVTQLSEASFRLTGDLTIKDVTRQISVDFDYEGVVNDPWGNVRLGFEGSVTINRKDFNVMWNAPLEAGGVLVSEKVTLEFEVAAVKTS